MGWLEYVIGGAAVAISAISLWVALSANQTQERLLAASTWPHLQFGTGNRLDDGTMAISFILHNAGVGPARVRSVVLSYDGKPVRYGGELLQACCGLGDGPLTTITSDPVRVLVAGEEIVFLRLDASGANPAVFEALNRERWKVSVEACYCSVLGDCWMFDSEVAEPQPIASCPAVSDDRRYRG